MHYTCFNDFLSFAVWCEGDHRVCHPGGADGLCLRYLVPNVQKLQEEQIKPTE
jgi:hypothetical protein